MAVEKLVMGVDVRGSTRDLVSSLAAGSGAVRAFRNEVRRANADARTQRIHARDLNRALLQQSMAVRNLTGDYVALRRTLLTLGVRTAITGFGALASAISSLGTVTVGLVGSLSQAAGALGILGAAAGAAAVQGLGVFQVAMKGVGKALTTQGQSFEKAMAKLTKPAREFVKVAKPLREFFRDTRVMAQREMFPGLTRGLKAASKIADELRQGIVDTSRVIGYLGERAGKVLGSNQREVYRILERNVVTLRRLGDTAINMGEGLMHAFTAAGPLIGHMTSGLVTASKKFEEFTRTHKAEMREFFSVLRSQYDHWTSIIGDTGRTIFAVFKAGQPVIEKTTTAIDNAAKRMREWAESERGQKGIRHWFEVMNPVAGEWAKTTGEALAAFGRLSLAGAENSKKLAIGLRTKVLPMLEDVFESLNARLFPALGDLAGSFVDLIRAARPALKTISSMISTAVHGFAGFVDIMGEVLKVFQRLGKPGEIIGGFLVGGAIIGSWRSLRAELQLAGLALRQVMGFIPRGTVGAGDFRSALPFYGAIEGARDARRFSSRSESDVAPPYFISTRGGERTGGGASGQAGGRAASRQRTRSRFYSDFQTARPVYARAPFEGIGRIQTRLYPSGFRDRDTGRYARPVRGNVLLTPAGSRRNGRFVPEPPIGPSAARARYEAQLQQGVNPLRQRGRVGRIVGVGADAMADTARATQRGIVAGARAAKPLVGGIFGTAVVGGIIGGLTSDGKNIGDKLRDALNLATFGIVPSTGEKQQQTAGRIGAMLARGEKTRSLSVKDVGAAIDFSQPGLRDNEKLLSTLFGKNRNKKAISLVDPQQVGALKQVVGELSKLGKIAPQDAGRLNKYLDDLAKRIDALRTAGLNGKQLKQALELGLDIKGPSDKAKEGLDRIKDGFDQLARSKSMDQIKGNVKANIEIINGELGRKSKVGQLALARNFKLAAAAVKDQMDKSGKHTKEGAALIRHYLIAALHALGLTHNAGDYLKGIDPVSGKPLTGEMATNGSGKARGGLMRVPGAVGPDSVAMKVANKNIVVAPGEDLAIINRHQRAFLDQRLADVGGLPGLFRKVNKRHNEPYARGGLVTGDTDYSPRMGKALEALSRASGTPIFVQSGGRTNAEQMYLKRTLGGSRPVAGMNGPHVQGIAADITPGRAVFGDLAGRFGLGFPVAQEPWHIQLMAAMAALPKPVVKQVISGLGGGVGSLVNVGLGNIRDAAQMIANTAWSSLSANGDGGPIPSFKGTWTKVMAQIASAKGWNLGDWKWIVDHESGGDPTARNKTSGALGLGQMLGANIAKYHGDGTPVEQIMGMAQYMEDRYGDPTVARAFWEAHGWYGGGGVPLPERGTPSPNVSPSDGVPLADQPGRDAKGKKKKPKAGAKKKAIVYPSGQRPRSTPFGTGLLHRKPRSAKELAARRRRINQAVKRAKKKVGGRFTLADPFIPVDPLTGEDLSVNASAKVKPIESVISMIAGIDDRLGRTTDAWSLIEPDVQFTVDDGTGNEVLNSMGLTVDGKFIPGIKQFVDEMNLEIGIHGQLRDAFWSEGTLTEKIIGGKPGMAIKERRDRLTKIRRLFRANRDVRRASTRKLNRMAKKGYDWKDAVTDNDQLLRAWRDFKREGSNLPEGYREKIDSIVSRIRDTNADLRRRKPAGGDVVLARQYQDDAAVAGAVNKYLVGDADKMSWLPISGGRAGAVLSSIGTWQALEDYRQDRLADVRDNYPKEIQAIKGLEKARDDAAGTKLRTPQSPGGLTDAERAAIAEEEANRLRTALSVFRAQNEVFGGFSKLVGARLVGAFAHGAVRVPETGLALVHKNETILPDPNGPFRNGMNAPGKTVVEPSIEVHIHGEALQALTRHVEAVVDGKVRDISNAMGARQRQMSAAPGRISR